jgi:hypothetical protein
MMHISPNLVSHESDVTRLAARVFVTDCMSTMFFRSPPQITVAEMCGDLPSADALFEASTSAEFSQLAATSTPFNPGSRSLKDLVSSFLHEDWDGPEPLKLARFGSEIMIPVIFGNLLWSYVIRLIVV